MRIAVAQLGLGQERPGLAQSLDHRRVGIARLAVVVVDPRAREERHVVHEIARAVDGLRHLESACLAQHEVVRAVTRRDVHEARALVHGDEIGRQHGHVEIIALAPERVGADRAEQLLTRKGRNPAARLDRQVLLDLRQQGLGHQQDLAGLRHALLADCRDLYGDIAGLNV